MPYRLASKTPFLHACAKLRPGRTLAGPYSRPTCTLSKPSTTSARLTPCWNRSQFAAAKLRLQANRPSDSNLVHSATSSASENSTVGGSMFVLGLTGSIGMGKSTVSNMFKKHGVPVMDADAVVHELYAAGGGAVPVIREMFPDAVVDNAVDRKILSTYVLGPEEEKKDNMKRLETAVHALVKEERLKFLRGSMDLPEKIVVLDVPLLFETKMESQVDAVAVVSAGEEAQRDRVLARPGMTEEKFTNILHKQVPDAEKRDRAEFVIDTSTSLEETEARVLTLISEVSGRDGKAAAEELRQ